jgi:hypothetical protein
MVPTPRRRATGQRLAVRLEQLDGQLILGVQDDGRGFDPERAIASRSGRGLCNMARRAAALGGRLRIAGQPGDGTQRSRCRPGGQRRKNMTSVESAVRVLVVDDYAVVRAGLAALLERHPRFTVVGGVGSASRRWRRRNACGQR